jgi:carbon monoxide dehydrogenase subunit G
MKLEQTFEVQAPADRVWSMLTDLASVAPCLPGAQLTDHGEDGSYEGTFTVKLGPTTASYRGRIHFQERDDEARRAVMHASGQDKRGQGGATATMITTVAENGPVSNVTVDTDLLITGKLARFGRGGMIEDISNRLLSDFASCLQAKLAEPAGAAGDGPTADDGGAPAQTDASGDSPASAGAASTEAQPAPNTISGTTLIVTTLKGTLRRNGPAIGVAVLAVAVLAGWRARRRRG